MSPAGILLSWSGTLATGDAVLDNPVADFSDTPWWLSLIKAVLVFLFLVINTVVMIWFERRIVGQLQSRPGPNRAGPFGIFQTLGDGLKLVLKEDVQPAKADRVVYTLAPFITGWMAFIGFSVIPLGGTVEMFGHTTPLQLMDAPIATLMVLAIAGVGVYGILLAGWSSGSTYPLLGGLRSSAQVISYEIAMGLALVGVFLYAGSMSTSQIVSAQRDTWFIIPAFFSFVIYLITMVAETNRLPFDLAEGEGEIVGGFHTEYSSMRFAMFFLGEYVNMFTVAGLATTLFLGGPAAPPGIAAINDGMFNQGWWGFLWFVVKMWSFMFFFVWLRGSLPRVRYDQLMRLGWKVLIPSTVVWVVIVAFMRAAQLGYLGNETLELFGREIARASLFVTGAAIVVVIIAYWVWASWADNRDMQTAAAHRPAAEVDPFAGGHPVPPLPGQKLVEPQPSLARVSAVPSTASEVSDDK